MSSKYGLIAFGVFLVVVGAVGGYLLLSEPEVPRATSAPARPLETRPPVQTVSVPKPDTGTPASQSSSAKPVDEPPRIEIPQEQTPAAPTPPRTSQEPTPPADSTPAQIEVRVETPSGAFIEGASISARNAAEEAPSATQEPAGQSDAKGRYVLSVPGAGEYAVTATHPDYVTANVTVTARPGTMIQTRIVLGHGGTVEGAVRRGDRPVGSYQVKVAGSGDDPQRSLSASTGPDGRYSIVNVPPGSITVLFPIPSPDLEKPQTTPVSAVVQYGKTTVVDFDVPAFSTVIEGAIRIEGELPQFGHVSAGVIGELGQDSQVVALDSEGQYRIENLQPGAVTLDMGVVAINGKQRRKIDTLVLADKATVRRDYDFPPAGSVSGTVKGVLEGERVTVVAIAGSVDLGSSMSALDKARLSQLVVTDADLTPEGTFQLEELDPGRYTIVAVGAPTDTVDATGALQSRSASQVVTVPSNAEVRITLTLR